MKLGIPLPSASPVLVPGLYVYGENIVDIRKNLAPSPREELEITDVNLTYLRQSELQVQMLRRGMAWLDTGTHASLLEAAIYIATPENR